MAGSGVGGSSLAESVDVGGTNGTKRDSEVCELSKQLRVALQKVTDRIYSCHKSSVLVKHFPFLEVRHGRWLECAAKQVFDEAKLMMEEDVDKVYTKYQLEEFLSTIMSLRQEAAHSTESAFRPSGSPQDDLRPFVMELLMPALMEQEKHLEEVESENAELMARVSESRQRLAATVERFEQEQDTFRQVRQAIPTIEPLKDKLSFLEQRLESLTDSDTSV